MGCYWVRNTETTLAGLRGAVEKGRQVIEIWVDGLAATLRRIEQGTICPDARAICNQQAHVIGEPTGSASL